MKRTDESLQRLLSAAAKAAPAAADAPPFGLETRVVSRWRAGSAEEDPVLLFMFFRRAVLGAGLALVLCAAWSFTGAGGNAAHDEGARLSYEIQMSLNP